MINSICPNGNENNRKRAMMLVQGGSVLCSIKKYIKCRSRLDPTLQTLQCKCKVIPSMKTKVTNAIDWNENSALEDHYTVHLSFNLNTKELLPYPHSTCGCYDGRHKCSHMPGFSLFIRCAQRCDISCEIFGKDFPESPVKLQNYLTLIENVAYSREHASSEAAANK